MAIKCLERGIHVLSETTSNSTMAEGVELVRAVEKSKAIYMLAENYPFMKFNLEMKKVYENGTLRKALFCEGEYNHPSQSSPRSVKELMPYDKHWRRYLPRTYYLTHSLAPLMWIMGATPKRVTAMPVYEPQMMSSGYVGDIGAIMTVLNDDNSVFRITGHSSFGGEDNAYRFCCEKG